MQLKDVAVVAFLFLGIPLPGWSQTAEEIRVWDETRARELARLPVVVRSYAHSIGCHVWFKPENVVRWEGIPEIKYVALISLDDGCAGGSGTWKSVLVAVREGASGKLYVHPAYSLAELTSMQLPQMIDAIYNTEHGVRFVGRIPQGDDPNNNPSKRVSGTVVWSGKEWTVPDGECIVQYC